MAKREIVAFPHPVLKQRCAEVKEFDEALHALLDDMALTMADAEGIGLAANQVDVPLRIFLMDVPLGEKQTTGIVEVINPVITATRGHTHYDEGCLSFPGLTETVKRHAEIDLSFQDRHGGTQSVQASGLVAICIQHEFDHLEGITFLDRLSPLKRRVAVREYLRENAELLADQERKTRTRQRRSTPN